MIVIESLRRDKHHRLGFSCGTEPLDRFLQEHAHQAVAKNLSKTYVAVDESDETVILGYYTVTTCRIEPGELPRDVARLAVSESVKGQGVGSLMLMDAMARCARVAAEIGGVAIVVDALEESVVPFYERVGFQRFERGSLKLFIPMATVREMLGFPAERRQAG